MAKKSEAENYRILFREDEKKMKSFLIIATQSGGCDYTIGCGVDYWYESANSIDELNDTVRTMLLDKNQEDEHLYPGRLSISGDCYGAYDTLTIIEVGQNISVPLKEIAKEYKDSINNEAARAKEAREKLEYERLRLKFYASTLK